jgi:4-aminobutyrate aminotransferase-like enzyme
MTTSGREVREAVDQTLAPRRADYQDYLAFPVDNPLSVERAELLYVFDSYGNQYLDLSTAALVNPLGHANPDVLDRVLDHLRHYGHTTSYSHHLLRYQVEYATALTSTLQLNGHTPRVLFAEGERDAVQTAIELATYRSSGSGLLVLGDYDWLRPRFLGSWTPLRSQLHVEDRDWHDVGAVLLDLVPGSEPADKYWIQTLVDVAKQRKVPVIVDESRTGFGRTGTLWAFEQWSIDPDYVVLGGPVGGGLPFGAVVAPEDSFTHLPKPATLAGFPVAAAAGLAVFRQITPPLVAHVRDAGVAFETAVAELVSQFPHLISGQNGTGLLRSIGLSTSEAAQRFWSDAHMQGLLVDHPGASSSVSYTPSLIISEEEIRRSVDAMANLLLDWESPP